MYIYREREINVANFTYIYIYIYTCMHFSQVHSELDW